MKELKAVLLALNQNPTDEEVFVMISQVSFVCMSMQGPLQHCELNSDHMKSVAHV